jgi:hypothetical protein
MKALLKHQTRIGTFYVAQSQDGRFHPVFDNEDLGSYANIMQAVDDLVNDADFSEFHSKSQIL